MHVLSKIDLTISKLEKDNPNLTELTLQLLTLEEEEVISSKFIHQLNMILFQTDSIYTRMTTFIFNGLVQIPMIMVMMVKELLVQIDTISLNQENQEAIIQFILITALCLID